jgi:hypothetical protein
MDRVGVLCARKMDSPEVRIRVERVPANARFWRFTHKINRIARLTRDCLMVCVDGGNAPGLVGEKADLPRVAGEKLIRPAFLRKAHSARAVREEARSARGVQPRAAKYPLSRRSLRRSGSCGRHPSELRVITLEVGLSIATKPASQSK